MFKFTLLLIFFITLACNGVGADIFTAVADVEPLLHTHRSIVRSLEEYLNNENRKLNTIMKYINLYKKEQEKMEADKSSFIGHPINIFTLIKRLTADLHFIEIVASTTYPIKKEFGVLYPTLEDLEGAATALLRLTKTYKLEVSQLAQGVVNGTFSHGLKPYFEQSLPLSTSDCFVIGRVLYESREQKSALEWLFEALQKNKEQDVNDIVAISETVIVDYIRACYHELDDVKNALIWTKRFLTLRPEVYATYNPLIEIYEQRIAEEELLDKRNAQYLHESKESTNTSTQGGIEVKVNKKYEALCRGQFPILDNKAKSLHCFYLSGPNPFLLLAPIKTEQLHHDPAVMLFHEVINDGEIEILKELGRRTMSRSLVEDNYGKPLIAKYRISKVGWLYDPLSPVIARITRRVSDFTGLSMETAEPLQVSNYGIGGHYEVHYDFLPKINPSVGARIATVLFYISDVEQGGATVFVSLNLTVFPVKRAAVFWMNLHPSGEPDYRTMHAACPVLLGSKWVANKWIHEIGQEFIRPCTLEYQKSKNSIKIVYQQY